MNGMQTQRKKIVVIGGGTGSFTVLSALKPHRHDLTAIVSMADDGGSTGVLRDELGVLPPGDVRQCLVALSESPKVRDLFNYRFEEGTFSGHSFGNLLLTALEKVTGSFAEAVETASEILRVDGRVIPATLDNVRLKMSWGNESVTLHGERVIDEDVFAHDPRKAVLSLEPKATANPSALQAIAEADLIVIAPGDLYTSLGPLLVIDGFGQALADTAAKVVYVCNLVTKHGQTDGFSVADHAAEIERFAGGSILDTVLYNTTEPVAELQHKYEDEQAYTVQATGHRSQDVHYKLIGGDYLGQMKDKTAADKLPVTRGFIRHDEEKLGIAISGMLER
jgi:uncharacterized cofD-like protein